VRCLTVALSVTAVLVFAGRADPSPSGKTVKIAATAAPWMIVGSHIGITGRVTPHPAGIEVTLERRQGSGWLPVGDEAVRSNGDFSFTARPDKVGLATYRVVTSKDSDYAGASDRVPVRVLHWQYLDSSDAFAYVVPTPGSGALHTGPLVSNGVNYEHAVSLDPGCYNQWGGDAWIDYPLERRYESFTATVGLGESAQAGATGSYTLIGAGKKLAFGQLEPGMSKRIKVSLNGIYRLRLMINIPDPGDYEGCGSSLPQVVFGDAQVLGP
jgi:hypothetical protein